jgi:hypothetical protein
LQHLHSMPQHVGGPVNVCPDQACELVQAAAMCYD